MPIQDSEQRRKPGPEIVQSSLDLARTILIVAPLVAVVVIVTLALLGASVGNTFSNIVSSL